MKFVILAGGHGKRLWPLSTEKKPKQFQAFLSDKTLLQEAYERLHFANKEDIFVSTNQDYESIVKEQLPELPTQNLISEPCLKDTAPCMCFATKYLEKLFGPDETISIIYADHRISNQSEFEKNIKKGHEIAKEEGKIVIVEVEAKSPNPNLGYAKIATEIEPGIFELDKFTEKPDTETAKRFVESGQYLWNTGLYIWKISTLLEYTKEFAPEIDKVLNSITDFNNCANDYEKFPKISLDYALIEKIDPKNILILKADLGWSDIGTWETLFKEIAANDKENLIKADALVENTSGSIIIDQTGNKKIVVCGQQNMVVINTNEAILVCPIEDSDTIKRILNDK